jgi:hypothetical protein
MPSDPFNDPAALEWAQRAVDELVPMLRDSFANVSIVPDEAGVADIKFAVELGLTLMLDKPLILAVAPGRRIPARLQRAADEIIEFDEDSPANTRARILAAMERIDLAEHDEPPC